MTYDLNFLKIIPLVLKWEGGYINDPQDPGGETKYGISKHSYPHLDIKNLTIPQAEDIYYQHYWIPSTANKITDIRLAYAVMDTAVNCGVSEALSLLPHAKTVEAYLNLRLAYYARLIMHNPRLEKFKDGWINRVEFVKKARF